MRIDLYRPVALTRDLPEQSLKCGDTATLVDYATHPADGERGCILEVFNALGDSLTIVAVPESAVEPLRADEIMAVRPLARAI